MFEIDGEIYFINLIAIDKTLKLTDGNNHTGGMIIETETLTTKGANDVIESTVINSKEFYKSKEVDGFRFNTIQSMLDIIMFDKLPEEGGETDSGVDSHSYKLAFNTLLMYGIIDIYKNKTK